MTFWPVYITVYTAQLHVEAVYLPIVLLVLVSTIKTVQHPSWKNLIVLGALIGQSLYFRSNLALYPFVVAVLLFWHHRRLGRSPLSFGIVMLVILMTLSPWAYRNYQVFDDFIFLSTSGGYNFAVYNRPDATGTGFGAFYPPGVPQHLTNGLRLPPHY